MHTVGTDRTPDFLSLSLLVAVDMNSGLQLHIDPNNTP
uniref:Uncharacterized protein n=1 Tax=Arundo donax TaxID=35708 RepID=A0A0A9BQR9_ARUDO